MKNIKALIHKRKIDRIGKRAYRKSHPELWIENYRRWFKPAHRVVWKAIKSGKLIRKPCQFCGEEKVHAHHDDYNKALEVKWMCPVHHKQYHQGRVLELKTI